MCAEVAAVSSSGRNTAIRRIIRSFPSICQKLEMQEMKV
jgi:hypothetical protein